MNAADRRTCRLKRQTLIVQPLILLVLLAALPHTAHAGDNLADNALAQIDAQQKPGKTRMNGAALADQALGAVAPKAVVNFPDRDAPTPRARWANMADQALDQLKPLPPARPTTARSVHVSKILLPPPVTHTQVNFAVAEPAAAAVQPTTPVAAHRAVATASPATMPQTVQAPAPATSVVNAIAPGAGSIPLQPAYTPPPTASVATASAPAAVPAAAVAAAPPNISGAAAAAPSATADVSATVEQSYARPTAPAPSVATAPLPELPLVVSPAAAHAPVPNPEPDTSVKLAATPAAKAETPAAVPAAPPPVIAPLRLRPVATLGGGGTAAAKTKPATADQPVASFAVIKTPAPGKTMTASKLNNRKLADDALANLDHTDPHTEPDAPLNFKGLTAAAAPPKPEPASGDLGTIDPKPHIDSPAAEMGAGQPADLKQELWQEWNEKLGLLEQENNALRAKLGQQGQDPLQDIRVDAVANIREKVLRERIAELEKELMTAQNKAKDTALQNAAKDAASNALAKPPVPPPPGAKELGMKDAGAKDSATKPAAQ